MRGGKKQEQDQNKKNQENEKMLTCVLHLDRRMMGESESIVLQFWTKIAK